MIVLSPSLTVLALILTGLTLALAAMILVLVKIVRRRAGFRVGGVYVGGEDVATLSKPMPSTLALYWGFTSRSLREAYLILRDVVHSGRLSDWAVYMALWYAILLAIAILVASVGGRVG